jgi:chitinase
MPLHKIILGTTTYARTYSLAIPIVQGLDSPVTGPGLGGGKLNYTSVCKFISSGATKEFDIYGQVPFAYKDYDWVAYENENSLALKSQWIVRANMGGIMTFALNYDDWKGLCDISTNSIQTIHYVYYYI